MAWFYIAASGDQVETTEAGIRSLISAGALTGEELAWHDGLEDWAPLNTLTPDLFPPSMAAGSPPFGNSPLPVTKSQTSVDPYQPPRSNIAGAAAFERDTPVSFLQLLFSTDGRIPRSRYWLGMLIGYGILFGPLIMLGSLGSLTDEAEEFTTLGTIVLIAVVIPSMWIRIAVSAKRWHDRDKSGWWVLIVLLPYLGSLWAFVENGCLAGTPGRNSYGINPLG